MQGLVSNERSENTSFLSLSSLQDRGLASVLLPHSAFGEIAQK